MEVSIDRVAIKKQAKKILDGKIQLLFFCNICFFFILIVIAAGAFLIPNPLEQILTTYIYGRGLDAMYLFGGIVNIEWVCWGIYMFLRSIIFFALLYPFSVCLATVPLALINDEKITPQSVFAPIQKTRYFVEYAVTGIQTYLFIILWSLLLFVPGIMAYYKFRYAKYIFVNDNEKTSAEALEASKKYLIDNRMSLFMLDMSFIGWFTIGIITCGLGLVFSVGYYQIVSALYFKHITGTINAQNAADDVHSSEEQ